MSELQGPRIPGEERSGRRRASGWIIGGLLALLLLALLIPFSCQALKGGSDSQGQDSGAQGKAIAQEAGDGQGGGGGTRDADGAKNTGATGAGENAQAEPVGDEGSQAGKDTAAVADGAAGSGAEDGGKTPNGGGDAKTGGDLPETGGMSPTALLAVGTVLLLMGSTGLSAAVCRRSASRG
jgi:hypothetical protein